MDPLHNNQPPCKYALNTKRTADHYSEYPGNVIEYLLFIELYVPTRRFADVIAAFSQS